jgi:hypothetical protein
MKCSARPLQTPLWAYKRQLQHPQLPAAPVAGVPHFSTYVLHFGRIARKVNPLSHSRVT